MSFLKQFGGKVTPQLKAQYAQSPYWHKDGFQNLEATDVTGDLSRLPRIIYKQLKGKKGMIPKTELPVLPFDKAAFLASSVDTKMIWYGHSVLFLRMNEKNILIDPMLGSDTTPIAPTSTNRFSKNTLSLIDDFPEIDLLLITHDHYDHLDFASIQKLKHKTQQYFVAMGVKRHLVHWGVDAQKITEFDWWNTQKFKGISVTFTPTRHFSGRGLTDRMKTLWGGWFFDNGKEKIWFSGDGGYGTHFNEIGQKLGGFDFAFMECGQYNTDWHPVHLFPDESVQAALDAGVKKAMPVHWGGFPLSYYHTWTDPVEEFLAAAEKENLACATPRLGEIFTIKSNQTEHWWKGLR